MNVIEFLEIILPNGKGDWTLADWGIWFTIVMVIGAVSIYVILPWLVD